MNGLLRMTLEWDLSGLPVAADLLEERGFGNVAEFLRRIQHGPVYTVTFDLWDVRELRANGDLGPLWAPQEHGIHRAWQMVEPLQKALQKYDRSNVPYRARFLCGSLDYFRAACEKYPTSFVGSKPEFISSPYGPEPWHGDLEDVEVDL